MEQASEQRRGRRIAMTPAQLDEFLSTQRTCRVATTGPDGPHVAPLWFFWDGASVWVNSLVRSQRWVDLHRDPRVALVVDDGEAFDELRGVEIHGRAEAVGDVPRRGAAVAELAGPERGFHDKYRDPGSPIPFDGRHAWLRVSPRKIVSWDFRKIDSTERQPS